MIDNKAVLLGTCEISERVFIGPFCVIGFPSTMESVDEAFFSADLCTLSGGSTIGAGTTLLSHVVVGEKTIIGENVWCDHHTFIGSDTHILNDVAIMYGARIYNRVLIGENAWVAGFVCNDVIIERNAIVLGQLVHRFVDVLVDQPEPAPIIREGAFVGMGATIIGGVEVGAGAYIGAGAVLTQSAQPGYLYVGNPAKQVGRAPSPFRTMQR